MNKSIKLPLGEYHQLLVQCNAPPFIIAINTHPTILQPYFNHRSLPLFIIDIAIQEIIKEQSYYRHYGYKKYRIPSAS